MKLFVLDNDMTLVDSSLVFHRAYSKALEKWGYKPLSFEEFWVRFCRDELIVPPGVPEAMFWECFKKEYIARSPRDIKPMPGARELLEEINKNGDYAIVVSGRGVDPSVLWEELRLLGLSDYIKEVHTLVGSGSGNPFDKTQVIRKAIEKLKPSMCIMIGDYMEDMKAARKAGCLAIGVTTGCKTPDKLREAGAHYVVPTLVEALDLLKSLGIL